MITVQPGGASIAGIGTDIARVDRIAAAYARHGDRFALRILGEREWPVFLRRKARDPQHAAKLFKRAAANTSGRWATFHFKSVDNPYISTAALSEISTDMTALAYRQEIMAEDVDEAPGALWTRAAIEAGRVLKAPDCEQVVVGVDPTATSTGDEAGIVTAGRNGEHFYILADDSTQGSPEQWARAAVTAYHRHSADAIIAESNNGGEMVASVIAQIDKAVPVRLVHASRGKMTRAEPIAVIYEQGRGHHVGSFPALEDEQCLWVPGDPSPNRMDALVWAATQIMLRGGGPIQQGTLPAKLRDWSGLNA